MPSSLQSGMGRHSPSIPGSRREVRLWQKDGGREQPGSNSTNRNASSTRRKQCISALQLISYSAYSISSAEKKYRRATHGCTASTTVPFHHTLSYFHIYDGILTTLMEKMITSWKWNFYNYAMSQFESVFNCPSKNKHDFIYIVFHAMKFVRILQ